MKAFAPRITKAEQTEWIGSTVYTDLGDGTVQRVYLKNGFRQFVVKIAGRNRHLDEKRVSI